MLVIFHFFSSFKWGADGGADGSGVLTFELMWRLSNSDREAPRAHCT